jgi:hypothetical protein
MRTIVHRVAGGYEHRGLYAIDGRGRRGQWLVLFMNHCRGVGDQKFERAPFISVITTEFVELLVGYSIAESIGANFCTIDGVS